MLDECAFVGDAYFATLCVGIGASPAALLMYEMPPSDPATPRLYPASVPVLAFLLPEIDNAQNIETRWEVVGGSAHSAADSQRASGGDFKTDCDNTLLMILFRIKTWL